MEYNPADIDFTKLKHSVKLVDSRVFMIVPNADEVDCEGSKL